MCMFVCVCVGVCASVCVCLCVCVCGLHAIAFFMVCSWPSQFTGVGVCASLCAGPCVLCVRVCVCVCVWPLQLRLLTCLPTLLQVQAHVQAEWRKEHPLLAQHMEVLVGAQGGWQQVLTPRTLHLDAHSCQAAERNIESQGSVGQCTLFLPDEGLVGVFVARQAPGTHPQVATSPAPPAHFEMLMRSDPLRLLGPEASSRDEQGSLYVGFLEPCVSVRRAPSGSLQAVPEPPLTGSPTPTLRRHPHLLRCLARVGAGQLPTQPGQHPYTTLASEAALPGWTAADYATLASLLTRAAPSTHAQHAMDQLHLHRQAQASFHLIMHPTHGHPQPAHPIPEPPCTPAATRPTLHEASAEANRSLRTFPASKHPTSSVQVLQSKLQKGQLPPLPVFTPPHPHQGVLKPIA